MKFNTLLFSIYGLFILVGGMIGYASAHSVASLVMGSLFAALLILSALAIHKGFLLGDFSGRFLTLLLAIFFAYRYLSTFKFMPAGMMAFLSLAVLIASFVQNSKTKQKST